MRSAPSQKDAVFAEEDVRVLTGCDDSEYSSKKRVTLPLSITILYAHMAPARTRPPKNRSWLLSLLLFGALVIMSLFSLTNPERIGDKEFTNAPEVSISEITRGYNAGAFSKIRVRDNKVFVTTITGAVLQSYKEGMDTVSQLGWNDPNNTTIVEVENREAQNMLLSVLPDILFLILVIGGLIWLFRGIARSQSNAMSFGKSRARIADATQVKPDLTMLLVWRKRKKTLLRWSTS